ncbi:hypothetical protein SAMN04487914_13938 [Arthrobacter sp. ok909]|nr:hypothetical protein SAMN04487914_13938 [Arthrobacter sp. ok909]
MSNDNPYSEVLFKTLKYGPEFPERFASVHDAGAFISGFVDGTTITTSTLESASTCPRTCTGRYKWMPIAGGVMVAIALVLLSTRKPASALWEFSACLAVIGC